MEIQNNLYDVFKIEYPDGYKYNIKHKNPDDFYDSYQVFLCGNIIDIKIKTGIRSLLSSIEEIHLHHAISKRRLKCSSYIS